MRKLIAIFMPTFLICSQTWGATTNKMSYGTNNQTISIASSIGSTQYKASASIDNTTNLFLDTLVFCKYTTGALANSTSTLNIFAYGTADGGTNYTDGVTGSSATYTPTTTPINLPVLGIISSTGTATTYSAGPFSVANSFGGVLPDHWGIVIQNPTSVATNNSSAGCWYQGIYVQNL